MELMKKCIKEGPSLTMEKAKTITKFEEGASQQIKIIPHNSNTENGSTDNIQRFKKTKIQPNRKHEVSRCNRVGLITTH